MKANYLAIARLGNCQSCQLDNPGDSDEVTDINRSVGEGGANEAGDTMAVQSRLNRVEPEEGGPVESLDVDGICGPLTKAAIKRFQLHYKELISDGRVDPNKNTWKKLRVITEGADALSPIPANGAPPKPKPKKPTAPKPPTAEELATQQMLNAALLLSRFRIFEAIKSINVSITELETLNLISIMNPSPKKTALFAAYNEKLLKMEELPTFDRVFHIAEANMTFAHVNDVLKRVRTIFVTMMDVIVANTFVTAKTEKNGSRHFLRVVKQKLLDSIHKGGAMADAPEQGWWKKNANLGHIRIGTQYLNDKALISVMIHEMAHFVSHPTTFLVGGHNSGLWNAALNDTHQQAVRNAFCYQWYANLASFKNQRRLSNSELELA